MLSLTLGAPLYVPATRDDLADIGNGHSLPHVRTVIFCTEDAILEQEVPRALTNVQKALPLFSGMPSAFDGTDAVPVRCLRPRSPQVLAEILSFDGIDVIHAFVLPKVNSENLTLWFSLLESHPSFRIMLCLETCDVFDPDKMMALRDILVKSPLRDRVICLRIGGLDILNLLALRRSCRRTIYDTPVGNCLHRLITIFTPAGFALSAPACECLDNHELLREELELDVLNGLFCKTALHPDQVDIIHNAYKISAKEIDMATALLDPQQPAVFRMHGRMCEKSTHHEWAKRILTRAEIYGIRSTRHRTE